MSMLRIPTPTISRGMPIPLRKSGDAEAVQVTKTTEFTIWEKGGRRRICLHVEYIR